LEEPEVTEEKAKENGDSAMTLHMKKTLADTHGLQGEILLEGEKYVF
jgi:hypothetical protein